MGVSGCQQRPVKLGVGCDTTLTCPRAGPTGGDGFAWPALMTCTHAAAVSALCLRKGTFTGDGDDGPWPGQAAADANIPAGW